MSIGSRSLSRTKKRFLAAALAKYPTIRAKRRLKFRLYEEHIGSHPGITAIPNPSLAYYVCPALISDPRLKERIRDLFRQQGLEAMEMDWQPLFHYPFLDIKNRDEGFQKASRLEKELILFPTGETVTEPKLDKIFGALS